MSIPKIVQRLAKVCFVMLTIFGLAFTFQAPSYAACTSSCTNDAVCAQRPDTCSDYNFGDLAVLLVTTNPPRPGQRVTRDRVFTPPYGVPQITNQVPIGTTAMNGTFTNAIPLPSTSSLRGYYQDTYFVGGQRGNTITYDVGIHVPCNGPSCGFSVSDRL